MDKVFDDYEKMLKTERPDCACILSEGKNLYESNSGSVLIIPRHSVKSRIMLIWPKRIPPGRFRQTSRGSLSFIIICLIIAAVCVKLWYMHHKA